MGDACQHHHADGPPGADEVARALSATETRLTASGERMTAARSRVLELLLAAGEPVKAYDLIAAYGEGGEAAKPPTVYRALEFLERLGFAHRLESLNAYVVCKHPHHHEMAAFAICENCGVVTEFSDPSIDERLTQWSDAHSFCSKKVTVEIRGLCEVCSK